jgi:hypothetical protein
VVAPELSPQGDRARSYETRGRAGAHFSREVRSGAKGHVAAPNLTSARRRGPVPRDTWQRRSLPRQGREVRSRGTRDHAETHLSRKMRSEAAGHMAAPELTSTERRGSKLHDT